MPPTDAELLDAYAGDGGEAAFLALYDRHAPAMYALAFRMMGGREADAADVLQDAWTRVLPRLMKFRGESSLRTWLCGFVVNCCRERFRGAVFEEIDLCAEDSTARMPQPVQALDLERGLAALPEGARAVVILHDIEGFTHREIAAVLGIGEGTSKSQLSRGRAALRRRLDPSTGSGSSRAKSRDIRAH
jgi:RNA polymerase sigma-70 factor (ECF subfamily)